MVTMGGVGTANVTATEKRVPVAIRIESCIVKSGIGKIWMYFCLWNTDPVLWLGMPSYITLKMETGWHSLKSNFALRKMLCTASPLRRGRHLKSERYNVMKA